ncbi:hypothetical protein BAE44_0019080 [Dichanthelium oligosanthes]|uniref:Basic secretory protease n=1 Tax=Dichanthelium oligosanthes TaxID=888268 RepID=A0A1E5V469_9POAL|nr:hypothetical protein BAE44_0019080 [Dichanthelium oligosanthes]
MESRLPAEVVSSILLLSAKSGAVTFEVTNAAVPNTTGGERFNKDIGLDYAKALSDASILIWNTFNQRSPADRKPVDTVTLVVEDEDNGMVAFTSGSTIHLSAQYVGGYSGDVKTEVTGLLFHETTHIWQWDGQGQANPALVEGIADFIRLKACRVCQQFLDYCNSLTPGFIALLNAKMKDGYYDDFFAQITGRSSNSSGRASSKHVRSNGGPFIYFLFH